MARDEGFRRKRRLLVRDWLYYVVWYVRLRKIVRGLMIEKEDKDGWHGYREMLGLVDGMSPGAQLKGIKDQLKRVTRNGGWGKNISKEFSVRVPKAQMSLMNDEFRHANLTFEVNGFAYESKKQMKTLPSPESLP